MSGNGHEYDYDDEFDDDDGDADIPVAEYVDLERRSNKWRWVAVGLFVIFAASALVGLRAFF